MKHCESGKAGADHDSASLSENPGTSSAPLDEFLINIKEPLPTFSFSFVQNGGCYASLCFRLGGWRGQRCDAGHFEPLDQQHSDYKRGNGRKLQAVHEMEAGQGANQEENWTLRIVSDDWSWIEGIGPIQFLFSNSPQCSRSHRNSALKVTKPLEREKVVYKIQSGTPASIQILQSAFIHLS